MTTFVGTQNDFSKALQELLELEYEALEIYEAAINRIEDVNYKQGLVNAKNDHNRHITDLIKILEDKKIDVPKGPGGTQWITIGKLAIANLIGDKTILNTMIQAEEDTNIAYKRMNERLDKFKESEEFLNLGLKDEIRHMTWLKQEAKS